MAFWSAETIRRRLPTLIDKPDVHCIDGAAYTLKVGPEYYVSPTELDADRNTRTVKTLALGEAFTIPPGQFALVLTEEIVTVPTNALGFFSIRSRVKWKGLVNVSGFHIDPGFSGRLTIAVYNAGPAPIHLRQGEPEFLIWIADLDAEALDKDAKHARPPVTRINVGVLNQAPGESESLQGLSIKIRNVDRELREKISKVERTNYVVGLVAAAILTLVITQVGRWVLDSYFQHSAPPAVSAPQILPAPAQPPAKQQP